MPCRFPMAENMRSLACQILINLDGYHCIATSWRFKPGQDPKEKLVKGGSTPDTNQTRAHEGDATFRS